MQRDNDRRHVIKQIESAFSMRKKPIHIVALDSPNTEDYYEALNFSDLIWSKTTSADWRVNPDAMFRFTPEAFCYFLPGVICASMSDGDQSLAVVDALLYTLDRSPTPEYWDNFFITRWPKLNDEECDAIIQWLFWLIDQPNSQVSEDVILRSAETLELVKKTRIDRSGA